MSATVRVFAPASIGNVAAGFDLLGAALAPLDGTLLGDIVTLGPSGQDAFRLEGPFAAQLSGESRPNLVMRALELFRERAGVPGAWSAVLDKRLPVNSGLGSSASSIVAALGACREAMGVAMDDLDLLDLAGQAEGAYSGAGHLDNVAPALLGGLRVLVPGPEGKATAQALPWPGDLVFVVVHPDHELPTAASRAVLPRELPLEGAVDFARNFGAFVHALHTGDRSLLARSLHDPVAEPHRARLVPGFVQARARALEAGALGFSLSGSGPSVFAVAERGLAPAVARNLQAAFEAAALSSQAWICRLDTRGARLI